MTDYYCRHPETYHLKTFRVNPASFLNPLAEKLLPGSSILDVGCASGRDMLWLKKRGFSVIGFERSAGLVALAEKNTASRIICDDFESYAFSDLSVDAILLVGALVHLPHESLCMILKRILNALSPGGLVLLTLKEGRGTATDATGRLFYLWDDDTLAGIFSVCGLKPLEFFRQPSSLGTDDVWLTYVLEKSESTKKR